MYKVIINTIKMLFLLTSLTIFALNSVLIASNNSVTFTDEISCIIQNLDINKNSSKDYKSLLQEETDHLLFLWLCLTAFNKDFVSLNFQNQDNLELSNGKLKLYNGNSVLPGIKQTYYDYHKLLELYKSSIPFLSDVLLSTKSKLNTYQQLYDFRTKLLKYLIIRYNNLLNKSRLEIDYEIVRQGFYDHLSTDILNKEFFCEYYPKRLDSVTSLNEKIGILTSSIRYQTRFNAAKLDKTHKDFNDSFLFFLMLAHCFEQVQDFDYVIWPKFEYRKSYNILDDDKYVVVRYFPTKNSNSVYTSIINEIPIEIVRSWNSIINDKSMSFEKRNAIAVIALQAVNYSIEKNRKHIKKEVLEHLVFAYEHIFNDAINRKIIDYDVQPHNRFLNELLKKAIFDATLSVQLENGQFLTEKELFRPQGFNVKNRRIEGVLEMSNIQLKEGKCRSEKVDVNINFIKETTDVGTFFGYKEHSKLDNIRIYQKYFFLKENTVSNPKRTYCEKNKWKKIIESEVKKDPFNIFKPYLRDLIPVNNSGMIVKKIIDDIDNNHIDMEIKTVNSLDLIGFTSLNGFPYISAIRLNISKAWNNVFK